ncbi:hypothetical protein ANCCEY_05267 [Ancylostoma ceylanicum]|uniref:Uncharacterized protein n=1 Tax=Ancylostoma ceylanicum TaxID=53326 RepID=A0A0D6LZV2_9BILA|nr:hypothetical protein ANCCEY_05267 [Ancylostoma ceylanicum]
MLCEERSLGALLLRRGQIDLELNLQNILFRVVHTSSNKHRRHLLFSVSGNCADFPILCYPRDRVTFPTIFLPFLSVFYPRCVERNTMATMTTPDSDNAESFSSAPLSFRAPVSNCAKSIIDRKLRKFASETSFATETASESSVEREFTGRTRVFTVKAVPRRMHHNAHQRARHDSDGSGGSEATVASGSATPRRAFRRPKSQGELHTSCTSATIHSLESAANVMVNDDRRPSHAYMIDDDSPKFSWIHGSTHKEASDDCKEDYDNE